MRNQQIDWYYVRVKTREPRLLAKSQGSRVLTNLLLWMTRFSQEKSVKYNFHVQKCLFFSKLSFMMGQDAKTMYSNL